MMHGGRLPAETSRFFGRARELAAVRASLARSRLVTLTGPGGVGKTRLAVRAAGQLAADFPDGVFIADLSAARDAPGVARAVAAALGLPLPSRRRGAAGPGAGPGAGTEPGWPAGQLAGRRLLLILDTAEHVIDACAALADAVLRGGDGPALIVTSRQALDRPGEVVFRIEPLPVGDGPGDGESPQDAVLLFADRAAAAAPGFALTAASLPPVVRLVRLLDGLPLAIELAAPRLRAVGLDELLDLLPGQLRALASGRRAAGDRGHSLEESTAWSYRLCSAAERRLWTRLSVFADGFDLAAAEAVCGPARPGADAGVLAPLIGLVDKSVVLRAPDSGGAARYRLLSIVREYGAAQAAGPAVTAGTGRHRLHYARVARDFAAAFIGPGQPGLVAALARDEANLRLALDGALAAGDAGAAASLAVDCWPALVSADRLAEAGAWLDRLRQPASPSAPQPAAPSAAVLAAALLAAQGDAAGAAARRASLPAGQPAGDQAPGGLPALVEGLGQAVAALRRGELGGCTARVDALTAGLPPGECWVRGWACWLSGVTRWWAGDRASAEAALRAGLELLAPFGGELAVAQHLEAFGWLAAARGDGRRAARLQGTADRIWQRLAADEGVRAPRFGLLLLDAERDLAERLARDLLGEAGYAGEHAAGAAMTAADAVREVLPHIALPLPAGPVAPLAPPPGAPPSGPGNPVWPVLPPTALPPSAVVPSPAGPADALPASPLPANALPASAPLPANTPLPAPAQPTAAPWAGEAAPAPADEARWGMLTAREREVAALVADGLTNKEIAARLVVSKRTVDAHLEHILGKLGYGSRVQVAALASAAHAREQPDSGPPGGRP